MHLSTKGDDLPEKSPEIILMHGIPLPFYRSQYLWIAGKTFSTDGST